MRRRAVARLVGLLPCLAVACSWTEFGDLRREAPVRALSRPAEMASVEYPAFLVPVSSPRTHGELVVTGQDNLSLVSFSFRADGGFDSETVPWDQFVLDGELVEELDAVALLPGSGPSPQLAAVSGQTPLRITLASPGTPFLLEALGPPLPGIVSVLGVGDAHGAGTSDIVVVAGPSLHVLPAGGTATTQSCDLGTAATAAAVGSGWVAVGAATGEGTVLIVEPPYDNDPDTGLCATLRALVAPNRSTGFGTAVVAADTDGDGYLEVVVSAPGDPGVYVYNLEDLAVPAAALAPSGAVPGSYGASLAFGHIGGAPMVVVGDPGIEDAASGTVWLLEMAGGTPIPVEAPSRDVRHFGAQVGVLPFVATGGELVDLLYATAAAKVADDPGVVYVFFRVTEADLEDPRELG